MPAAQRKKRVGAHEAKENAVRLKFGAQAEQRLKSEVGSAGGLWSIGKRNGEARLAGDGQAGHGQAVFKAGGGSMRFERLRSDRGKKHGIQMERGTGSARHCQMTQMRRVKTAAEEGDATAAR